jgi:hypothetical protein
MYKRCVHASGYAYGHPAYVLAQQEQRRDSLVSGFFGRSKFLFGEPERSAVWVEVLALGEVEDVAQHGGNVTHFGHREGLAITLWLAFHCDVDDATGIDHEIRRIEDTALL